MDLFAEKPKQKKMPLKKQIPKNITLNLKILIFCF